MLCILVIVLGFDGVASQGGATRKLHVLRVARLWVDILIGSPPGRAGCGAVRATRESPAVVALINGHERRGGFSTVAPCVGADHLTLLQWCAKTARRGH